jgi:hypothetical protein
LFHNIQSIKFYSSLILILLFYNRIRLNFENPKKILSSFGVKFDAIVKSVKDQFLPKLNRLIQIEQRRAGEKVKTASVTKGKVDSLAQFRSAGGDDIGKSKRGGGDDEDGDGGVDFGDDDEETSSKSSKKKLSTLDSLMDGDDDDEDDEEEDEKDSKKKGKKEISGYDDDSDDDVMDDGTTPKKVNKKLTSDSESDNESSDSSDDETPLFNKNEAAASKSKSAPKSAKKVLFDDGKKSTKYPKKKLIMGADEEVFVNEKDGYTEITLTFPATMRRVLMAQLAEKATESVTVRSTKNLVTCYPVKVIDNLSIHMYLFLCFYYDNDDQPLFLTFGGSIINLIFEN